MRIPRFTDSHRYRLKYVRAALSRAPGYLRRRFDKYAPGWRTAQEQRK